MNEDFIAISSLRQGGIDIYLLRCYEA